MGSYSSPDIQYTVFRISPTSPNFSTLVSRYRDTKLAALKDYPTHWAQRYDLEADLPLSVWPARFARQNTALVCVATTDPTLSTEDVLQQGEWVGFAVVRGPMTYEEYYANPAIMKVPREQAELETRWYMYDLFTTPAHRNRGVAQRLFKNCEEIFKENALAEASGTKKFAKLMLFANSRSIKTVEWYRKNEFRDHGMVTLKEGYTANTMYESIPEDTSSTEELRSFWENRIGLAMEKVFKV